MLDATSEIIPVKPATPPEHMGNYKPLAQGEGFPAEKTGRHKGKKAVSVASGGQSST